MADDRLQRKTKAQERKKKMRGGKRARDCSRNNRKSEKLFFFWPEQRCEFEFEYESSLKIVALVVVARILAKATAENISPVEVKLTAILAVAAFTAIAAIAAVTAHATAAVSLLLPPPSVLRPTAVHRAYLWRHYWHIRLYSLSNTSHTFFPFFWFRLCVLALRETHGVTCVSSSCSDDNKTTKCRVRAVATPFAPVRSVMRKTRNGVKKRGSSLK